MACEVESEVESLLLYIDSVIRGYHVYKDVWEVSYIEKCCNVVMHTAITILSVAFWVRQQKFPLF